MQLLYIIIPIIVLRINWSLCGSGGRPTIQKFTDMVDKIKATITKSRTTVTKLIDNNISNIFKSEHNASRKIDVSVNDALRQISLIEDHGISSRSSANGCVVISRAALLRLQANGKTRLRNIANVAVNRLLSIKVEILRTLQDYLGLVNGFITKFADCNITDIQCLGDAFGEAANILVELITDLPLLLATIFENVSEIVQGAIRNIAGITSDVLTLAMDTLSNVSRCIGNIG